MPVLGKTAAQKVGNGIDAIDREGILRARAELARLSGHRDASEVARELRRRADKIEACAPSGASPRAAPRLGVGLGLGLNVTVARLRGRRKHARATRHL